MGSQERGSFTVFNRESLETSTKKQVSSWKTKMLKLTLVMATILLNVVAPPPPKDAKAYLSVPHFKDCLGKNYPVARFGFPGQTFWCKLEEKPEKCPLESWKQLHEAGG